MKSRMPERARTDPWEPQGSNPLGPPGPEPNDANGISRARDVRGKALDEAVDALMAKLSSGVRLS